MANFSSAIARCFGECFMGFKTRVKGKLMLKKSQYHSTWTCAMNVLDIAMVTVILNGK